jgi:hypothetical protein
MLVVTCETKSHLTLELTGAPRTAPNLRQKKTDDRQAIGASGSMSGYVGVPPPAAPNVF